MPGRGEVGGVADLEQCTGAGARHIRFRKGYSSGELAVLPVRAHLAAGETDAAEAVLRVTASAPSLLPATPVDRCPAETAPALRSHRRTKALHALDRALALDRPNGLVRPFALADARVGDPLIDHSGEFGSLNRFAQAVRGRIVPHAPPSGLTDRDTVTHVRASYGKRRGDGEHCAERAQQPGPEHQRQHGDRSGQTDRAGDEPGLDQRLHHEVQCGVDHEHHEQAAPAAVEQRDHRGRREADHEEAAEDGRHEQVAPGAGGETF